jgi:hypothetical protein
MLKSDMWERGFQIHGNIVSRKVADELFLVPVTGNIANMQRIFTLNPVAEYIWQELQNHKTLSEIRDGILKTFEVGKKQAESDIREFISELIDAGLISE